ncbi:cytochrome P450 [Aldersonia sp. NBC_00410]|uniref:cytochrome P450 n=1 Tax=Aldersonia sp. NBC_00410 TaxID=2975954 RepID=UPI00225A501E|nr:cytochrome P450 [Aldersonia sp. NBC_00410]MCX5044964.1 cytochrome P450 [Aldersonia sp. NBC_00410]
MSIGLWARWVALHGIPRAFMTQRASRGDPLGQIIASHGRAIDPYPVYANLRSRGPLVRSPFAWASADHGVCRELLRDRNFGVTAPADMDLPRPLRALLARTDPGVANPVEPPAMVIVNPPDHTRYRQLVAQSFTPRAIETLRERVNELTTELVDGLAAHDRPDLIADFAAELPVAIIAEIIGLPSDSHAQLLQWGRCGAPLLDVGIGWRTYRNAINGLRDIDGYINERFRQIRAGEASETAFSRLATDDSLTPRELAANGALLVGAGFETTVNLIGNGIVALSRHPEQLARLRAEPDLWPGAVEEILRYESPVQMTARTALRDVEIAGHRVREGEMVVLLLGGANRDPNVFTDPDTFDIGRVNARDHLAFASGIHACIGAALARIEGTTALRALFEAYPDLSLAGEPQRRGLVNLFGYERLPVRLGSRHDAAVH